MIDVTGVDIIKFIQKVYELSQPQGLGLLHFRSGDLTEEDAKSFIRDDGEVHLDYVKGRSCKMNVTKEDGKLLIRNSWYDHTDSQLSELLEFVGIKNAAKTQHGSACNCGDCREKRGGGKIRPNRSF